MSSRPSTNGAVAGGKVVSGLEDVGDDQKGKVGAVPDGLHPGD